MEQGVPVAIPGWLCGCCSGVHRSTIPQLRLLLYGACSAGIIFFSNWNHPWRCSKLRGLNLHSFWSAEPLDVLLMKNEPIEKWSPKTVVRWRMKCSSQRILRNILYYSSGSSTSGTTSPPPRTNIIFQNFFLVQAAIDLFGKSRIRNTRSRATM